MVTSTKKKKAKKKVTKKATTAKKKTAKKKTRKEGTGLQNKKGIEELLTPPVVVPINTPEKYVLGRPTEYCNTFPQKVYEACTSGECLTLASLCCMLEICRPTLYDWIKKFPEFSYAIKKGTEFRKLHMEKKGFAGIHQGKGFNAVPWLFLTKNMFPDEYKDKQEIDLGNKEGEDFSFNFVLDKTPDHRK